MPNKVDKPGNPPQPSPRPSPEPKRPGAIIIAASPHAVAVKLLSLLFVLCLTPAAASAQSSRERAGRFTMVAGAGFASTWDDEGLLGRGAAVSGGAGVWLTERIALIGFVDRVAYYRDVEWLTFDGRTVFGGAEASLRFSPRRTSLYATAGAGVLNDSGIWLRKVQTGSSSPRVDERIDRGGSQATMTVSGGVDVAVTRRVSVRGGIRYYGLLDTGEDLFPHVGIQPTVALLVLF